MTGVQDGNAAREIEILTAFDIPHPTIFRPLGENRVNLPHAARNGVMTALH